VYIEKKVIHITLAHAVNWSVETAVNCLNNTHEEQGISLYRIYTIFLLWFLCCICWCIPQKTI